MQYLLGYDEWVNESMKDWRLGQSELITEEVGWLSTSLHLIGDVAAAVSDMVVPGSGGAIDAMNALSYFIEASTKTDEDDKCLLIISGIIQIVAIFAIGPLQAFCTNLKLEIKSLFTAMKTSKVLLSKTTAATIEIAINSLLKNVQSLKAGILKMIGAGSKFEAVAIWLAEKILGTKPGSIAAAIAKVTTWIDNLLVKTIEPALKKVLEKLKVFNPEHLVKIAKVTTAGEAEDFVAKNIAKAAASGVINNKITSKISDAWAEFNKRWFTDYSGRVAPSDTFSNINQQTNQRFQMQMQGLKPATTTTGSQASGANFQYTTIPTH